LSEARVLRNRWAKLTVGYSKRSLAEKLGIKEGFRIAILNPPENYTSVLGALPAGVTVDDRGRAGMDLIQCFVMSKREAASAISALKDNISPGGALWVSWPKVSSGVKTDLNENVIREIGLKSGLVDVKVCAVDETWSGLKLVYRLKDRSSRRLSHRAIE
jgi:hypothetical protein